MPFRIPIVDKEIALARADYARRVLAGLVPMPEDNEDIYNLFTGESDDASANLAMAIAAECRTVADEERAVAFLERVGRNTMAFYLREIGA